MLLMPLMTAPALAALMWKLMTNPGFGIMSYWLTLIGIDDFRWAASPDTALMTVVLVDIWVYTPFIMILLLAGLRSLPTQPFEAAALDGVPRFQQFWRITLPMLMPYILTATLFRLLESIQQFDIIYAMTQGGPGDRLTVFQVEAYLNFFQSTNVGRSSALLLILWAITFMQHSSTLERVLRAIALTLIVVFFMFPILWIFLMSFQTNDTILRIPPSVIFEPTLDNYRALITGELKTQAAALKINFMLNLWNSVLLSVASVALALLLGVPAAYAFARHKFRGSEDIAFTLLSFRFAPPLLVLLPLSLYFQKIGLADTYIGLIWVYQLICLPLILWIVRGYFEDISPDIEHAYRIAGHSWFKTFRKISLPLAGPGIAAAGLLAFIFAWNNFIFALVLASASKQPVTVGALAFVTASGIQYGQIAAAIVMSITPTLALALYAQRYLVEGLSLGAVKG